MNELHITTHSPDETRSLGRRLGEILDAGCCVALSGPLGAGKTLLVRGIAEGAGVPEHVTVNSPTFVIVNEYPGRFPLLHIDAYRLSGPEELLDIGFDEMTTGGGAVIVEWADRVAGILPRDHLAARIDHAGESVRRFVWRAGGERSQRMLTALAATS